MQRTSTFSLRISDEVRKLIEKNAQILRIKPSTLAAMILRDCTEDWVKEYAKSIYDVLYPKEEEEKKW